MIINYTKGEETVDIIEEKRYMRMEAVVMVEMRDGETMEDAEDRFLCGLPEGMDCLSYKSSMYVPD